ncbi:MAG: hypothetical protein Tsb0015_17340 [Simkaniaceae bacterium]
MIRYSIHLLFSAYTLMLFVRILGSWIPNLSKYRFFHFLSHYTDPFLNVFRRIIPPVGGVLDLSPILAFFSLQILEKILLSLF